MGNENIRIPDPDELSDRDEEALAALVRVCNQEEQTHYGPLEDTDHLLLLETGTGKLLAALGIYLLGDTEGGRPVAEISAFTHPKIRRRGCFQRLLKKAKAEFLNGCGTPERTASPEHRYALRFAVYGNPSAASALQALSAAFLYEERMMSRALLPAPDGWPAPDKANGPASAKERFSMLLLSDEPKEWLFQSPYAECSARILGSRAYIYGVLTYPRHRRKGHAKRLLCHALTRLSESGSTEAFLQVSSANLPAVRLYQSLSFGTADRLMYYSVIE